MSRPSKHCISTGLFIESQRFRNVGATEIFFSWRQNYVRWICELETAHMQSIKGPRAFLTSDAESDFQSPLSPLRYWPLEWEALVLVKPFVELLGNFHFILDIPCQVRGISTRIYRPLNTCHASVWVCVPVLSLENLFLLLWCDWPPHRRSVLLLP